jgi:hypothetical protein
MLLTKKQREILDSQVDDNESYHGFYDTMMEERLMELDPQFMKALERHREKNDVNFWYA